jgi:hypothetical protein
LEAAAAPSSLVRLFDPAGEIENIVRLSEGRSVRKLSAVVFFRNHPVYVERVVPLLEKELTSTNELLAAAARKTLETYRNIVDGQQATSLTAK